jgi:hypothetical protein
MHRVVTTYHLEMLKYLVVDGYFGKKKFVDGVCTLDMHVVGKFRRDANLRYLNSVRSIASENPALKMAVEVIDIRAWADTAPGADTSGIPQESMSGSRAFVPALLGPQYSAHIPILFYPRWPWPSVFHPD